MKSLNIDRCYFSEYVHALMAINESFYSSSSICLNLGQKRGKYLCRNVNCKLENIKIKEIQE